MMNSKALLQWRSWQYLLLTCALIGSTDAVSLQKRAASASTARAHEGVYSVQRLLDRLKEAADEATKNREDAEGRIEDEKDRLTAVAELVMNTTGASVDSKDVLALMDTIKHNEEARVESLVAEEAMLSFYYSLRGALGSHGAAPMCRYLSCSPYAECHESNGEARCKCKHCFEGDGFTCRSSKCVLDLYAEPLPVLPRPPAYSEAKLAADLHLAAFGRNMVALVFRDPSVNNSGFLMIGRAGSEAVDWSPPQPFTNMTAAYEPVVVVLPTGRLLIAFRDAYSSAIGYIVGGQATTYGNLSVQLTEPQAYARDQSEKMALVPLANSQVACMFAEPEITIGGVTRHAFGGVALLKVGEAGHVNLEGKYHFTQAEVSRMAVARVSPRSFVIAFQARPHAGSQPLMGSAELSAVWLELQDGELVQHPHPLQLEPTKTDMRARDVALVSQNLLAYSYHSGGEEQTKVAMVRLDPLTKEMHMQGNPEVISSGATYDVHGISIPLGGNMSAPYVLTYMRHHKDGAVAKSCKVEYEAGVGSCHSLQWAAVDTASASAARLGDGRLLFAYTDATGTPFVQFVQTPSSAE